MAAGKSTIVNYLLGNPLIQWMEAIHGMRKDRKQGRIYLANESNSQAAEMGDKRSAGTKYIHTYVCKPGGTSGPSFPILDTPGIFDKDADHDVINLLTLERAIQKVQNIKLAVIIDYNQLQVERGLSLIRMARKLGELLSPDVLHQAQHNKVPNQRHPNLLFIVNKLPEGFKSDRHKHIVEELKEIREVLQADLQKPKDSASMTSIANAIQLCLIMEQTPESHLIIVNPVDEGESRSLIFEAIRTTVAISANQLYF
jgi:hypothetical protein